MPLDTIYKVFVALWAGFLVVAVYFDNVVGAKRYVAKVRLWELPGARLWCYS
jgi:hypothetical protein